MGFTGFTSGRTNLTHGRRDHRARRRQAHRQDASLAGRPERLEDRTLFAATAPEVSVLWKGATGTAYQGEYVALSTNPAKLQALVTKEGFTALTSLGGGGFYSFSTTEPVAYMARLATHAGLGFSAIQPNFVSMPMSVDVPDDTLFSQQWGLSNTGQLESFDYNNNGAVTPYNEQSFPNGPPGGVDDFPSPPNPDENHYGTVGDDIDAEQAWGITTGSKSVVVADIDTGLDITNPDIIPNLWTNPLDTAANNYDGDGYPGDIHGYNTGDNDDDLTDIVGHGTNTAGIIGAAGDNGQGVTGVDQNVSILSVKAGDASGFSDASLIAAVNYCVNLKDHGINLVAMNESLGGTSYPIDALMADSIRQAGKAGILDIVAAGNSSEDLDRTTSTPGQFSASLPSVITVAAVDNQFKIADFSNFGAETVDLGAPGVNILSTEPLAPFTDETTATPYDFVADTQVYGYESGTSQATPMVTGIIALEAAANPSASAAQLKAALLDGVTYDPNLAAQNGNPALVRTSGVANAYKAVLNILNPFDGADTTTGGTWHSFYGYQAAYVVGDTTAFSSSFVNVTTGGGSPVVVQSNATNAADLQRASDPSERLSAYEGAATTETISLDFTDGQRHRTELYLLDADHKHRTETVSLIDTATGDVINEQTVTAFTKGEYLAWDLQGSVELVITSVSGGAAYSGLFFDQATTAPTTYQDTDTATTGADWRNTYGSQGSYIVADNNTDTLPSYVSSFSVVGGTQDVVKAVTKNTNGLQGNYDLTHNIEAYDASSDQEDVNVAFDDSLVHIVTLYVADYDNKHRSERISVIDSASGGVLVQQELTNFKKGAYVSFAVSGAVTFRIDRTAGTSAVFSGVFFDAPFGENAHFDGTLTGAGGDWSANGFGVSDAYVVGDDFPELDAVPASSTISITGASRGVVATPTANRTALDKTEASSISTRVEAYAYTTSSMTISYNPGDYVQHELTMYFADYENFHRTESVTLYNATTNQVLAHQVITNFKSGKYLSYDVSGPILIVINNGTFPNAVLSGLFID
jgi:subtilisin family serine protease